MPIKVLFPDGWGGVLSSGRDVKEGYWDRYVGVMGTDKGATMWRFIYRRRNDKVWQYWDHQSEEYVEMPEMSGLNGS